MSAAKSVRPRRVFAGLKQRRRGAAPMFETDQTPAEVAHALGVSRQSVSRWAEQYLAGGAARLHDSFQYNLQADGHWDIQRLEP